MAAFEHYLHSFQGKNISEIDLFSRLVFSRFFDIRGTLGNVKKNRLEKLVSAAK